jgi:DNA-binding SARP family transcriptional activator/tetratricopeptide (TPR) repeat protein
MAKPRGYLRLFSGVVLEIDGAPAGGGRATQRRRLAILALLAASPTRQLSRDKLIGYLWPESETEAARHLLAGAVYELRKALGEKAILSRGEDLALNPDLVGSDLSDLEAAIESGDRKGAIELYRGAFADGFFVSEAPEFESWVEEQRSRYGRLFRELLEAEAIGWEKAGQPAPAADHWIRLAALDPADVRVTLKAMHSLHAAGQTAAAIRQGQAHAATIRRELGAHPDPAITVLVEQLRRTPEPVSVAGSMRDKSQRETPAEVGAARPSGSQPIASRPALIAGFVGGALVLALVALVGLGGHSNRPADAVLPPRRVLLIPFAVPDTLDMQLRAHLTTLLQTGLDGAGDIQIVRTGTDEPTIASGPEVDLAAARRLAARVGAGGYVLTQVEEASGTLRLRARLYTMGHEVPLVQAAASGERARVAETVDRLVLDLLDGWPRPPADRLSGVAARSTRSVLALKAWLNGEREYRAGRFLAATDAFTRAIQHDSAFALGYYRLSQSRLAADFPETEVIQLDARALQLSEHLPERDRMLIRAYLHFRKGEAESAEQRYQSLVNLYPDDVDAWTELGETRFHYNPLRGLPIAQARQAFERAADLDPGNWTVLWHLAQLEAIEGKRDSFVRTVDRLLAMEPENAQNLDLRYLRTLALGDRTAEARLTEEIANADELRLFQLIWRAAVFLRDLEGAERVARVLAKPGRPSYPRMLGNLSIVYLATARGDLSQAEEQLRIAGSIPGVNAQVLNARVFLALHPGSKTGHRELLVLKDSVLAQSRRGGVEQVASHLGLLGMIESALNDSAALARASQLERMGDSTAALIIRADWAHRKGQFREALNLLTRRTHGAWYGYLVGSPLSLDSYVRWLHGEVLRQLGRPEEGAAWHQSLNEFSIADLVYAQQAQ